MLIIILKSDTMSSANIKKKYRIKMAEASMITYNMENNRGSKTKFLYDSIKNDIRKGRIMAGEKLPSKRSLAEHLGIGIITVENAYAMLEEEGYIEARPRSGFYCMELNLMTECKTENDRLIPLVENRDFSTDSEEKIPHGMTGIMRRLLSERPGILLEKPPHLGCAVLRNAIAEYLRRYRGMTVQPVNVVVGSGAEYLYGMLVQLFGRDTVFGIEYPSYEKIEQVYISNGAKTVHLPMDNDGIRTDALQESRAQILHVSPYHSYPTGITASAGKRYEYISYALNRGGYVIEDDFDSEFSFSRKPIEPMFSMDRNGIVVYLNTFSKSIAPSFRIAYLVLPDRLLAEFSEKLGFYSCTVPVFEQYVLAEFIRSGGFERHLNRLRRNIR